MFDDVFDYVVIGAGAAGCIVAARLGVDPNVSVALMEAGGMDTAPATDPPGVAPMFGLWNPQGEEDWGYETVPQPGLDGRSIPIARGRVLGGSSAINGMIHVRGNRRDFDLWGQAGNHGWSYADVLPYFKKSETYHGPLSPFRGDNGPLPVSDMQTCSEASHAFIRAAATLGATRKYNDLNGGDQEAGAGLYQSTRTLDGTPVTALSAFLKPVLKQDNLQLFTGGRATGVLLERGHVRFIEYIGPEGVDTLRVKREVVLCAGAIETPKLMMFSGLGPAAQLRRFGIPVVRDLPEVGENLQDHLVLGVGYQSRRPLDSPQLLAEAGLFTWTGIHPEEDASPDLQYFFGPVQFVPDEYRTDAPGFTFAPVLAQPDSRGRVMLASKNPLVNVQVDPQYLSREEDIAVLEYGIRYARELVRTHAFDDLRGRELAPGEDVTTSADLRAYIRQAAFTLGHPCGTCRMGKEDPEAVVDDQLKVRQVEGLRIADASIMPRLVNGNPNTATMMIAEKAAALIRADQYLWNDLLP